MGLRQYSQQALHAITALDYYAASLPLSSQREMAAYLGQLEISLSHIHSLSASGNHGHVEAQRGRMTPDDFLPQYSFHSGL